MSVRNRTLTPRDWSAVEDQYRTSDPFNYAVLDDFLPGPLLESIRARLMFDWGWQYKNWQAQELYVRDPEIPEISDIAPS